MSNANSRINGKHSRKSRSSLLTSIANDETIQQVEPVKTAIGDRHEWQKTGGNGFFYFFKGWEEM